MNKFLFLSIFFLSLGYNSSQLLSQTQQSSLSKDHFAKIAPKISQHALELAHELSALDQELQLVYLNLFALTSDESLKECIKCAEYIESKKELSRIHAKLGENIFAIFQLYISNIEKKIDEKKLSKANKEKLGRKIEQKMLELMQYINNIYYNTLYTHFVKRNNKAAVYMFDSNGLIAKNERNRPLPEPQ